MGLPGIEPGLQSLELYVLPLHHKPANWDHVLKYVFAHYIAQAHGFSDYDGESKKDNDPSRGLAVSRTLQIAMEGFEPPVPGL